MITDADIAVFIVVVVILLWWIVDIVMNCD